MRNGSGIERPAIPDTWGNENTLPTPAPESLIENNSLVFQPGLTSDTSSSTILSPTEEYLLMTKRLIESNSLPPRVRIILEDLYVRYKSIQGYGPATWDTPDEIVAKMETPGKNSRKVLIADEEKPSTSKEEETLSTNSREFDKSEQIKSRRAMRISAVEAEQRRSRIQAVQDLDLAHHCDSEFFVINDVFSDFSLRDAGQDRTLKRRIGHWVSKQGEGFSGSSSVRQNTVTFEENRSNGNVDQGTEKRADGRLRKMLKNIKADKQVGTIKQ